jgi:hypothetical protein
MYARTDRLRPAVPFISADASHLYAIQLSYSHTVPRTLDPNHQSASTSTSWVDALDHPVLSAGKIRLALFRGICCPSLPRWTRECHYRTLLDAWPLGNDRCQDAQDRMPNCAGSAGG